MIFQKTVSVAAGGSSSSPLKTTLELTKGLIYKIEVWFPPGSSGLMGVAVFDKLTWLYPSVHGEYFIGDNLQIDYDETYIIENPPYEFSIQYYNSDTLFSHTFVIRIGLLTRDDLIVRYLPKSEIGLLLEAIEKEKSQQSLTESASIQKILSLLRD